MAAVTVSPQQVFARMAHRTGLLGETYHKKRSLAPLVSAVCAIRGQRIDQAHLVLSARIPKYKPADLDRDLQKHALVRTWGVRGVLQLVPTPELGDYIGAGDVSPRWRRFLEGKTKLSPQARLRLLKRLCPEVITRDGLREAFPDSSMRQFILREAAQGGHIVWKEGDGSGASYVWTEHVLGKTVDAERDLRPLIRRYLSSYGPLTAADLGSWLGVTVAAARQLMAKHRVMEVLTEGEETSTFIREDDLEELQRTRKTAVRGLVVTPPADPLVLAYKTRWRDESSSDDAPGLVFIDGRLAARWSIGRTDVTIDIVDEAARKHATNGVRSLLERAGVEASLTAATG